jgi:hypothetical protein
VSGHGSRATNRQVRALRSERRNWLAARYVPWGWPWCDGPGSAHHQEICCEGCATAVWCRHRAAEIAEQIRQLEVSQAPRVQGALW